MENEPSVNTQIVVVVQKTNYTDAQKRAILKYREKNPDKFKGEYTEARKECNLRWRHNNRDKVNEYARKYYQKRKMAKLSEAETNI